MHAQKRSELFLEFFSELYLCGSYLYYEHFFFQIREEKNVYILVGGYEKMLTSCVEWVQENDGICR